MQEMVPQWYWWVIGVLAALYVVSMTFAFRAWDRAAKAWKRTGDSWDKVGK